jgi:hypothetical protein
MDMMKNKSIPCLTMQKKNRGYVTSYARKMYPTEISFILYIDAVPSYLNHKTL